MFQFYAINEVNEIYFLTLAIYKKSDMALSGQKTKADFIDWNKLQNLILRLERDGNNRFALLIGIGAYTGLRISDILCLKWNELINAEFIEVVEKKTSKYRKIRINQYLKDLVNRNYKNEPLDNNIFVNRFNTSTISVQYVNRELKKIASDYNISKEPEKIKSHSLRKTFGRRVFENNDNSEKSLILLSEIFNHVSIRTTRIYLGIREKEIFDVYDNL